MDHLVIAHVVQVCSNLQLSKRSVRCLLYVAMKEIMSCIFYATAMAHCRVGTGVFVVFWPKGQDLVSLIPYVGVYEVHVSRLFFFQSSSFRCREFVLFSKTL